MLWIILHLIVVFVWMPLLIITIPLHMISSVKKDNARTRNYIRRQQNK